MRGGVTGVGADRHFQCCTRLVVLALRGVQYGEVVVRFRQFGVVLRQLGEDLDRILRLVLLGEQDAAQEAAAGIFGFGFQILINTLKRAIHLPLFQQLLGFLQFVGLGEYGGCKQQADGDCSEPRRGQFLGHRVIIPAVVVGTGIIVEATALVLEFSGFYQEQPPIQPSLAEEAPGPRPACANGVGRTQN